MAIVSLGMLGSCRKDEIRFTKSPTRGTVKPDWKATLSTALVAMPVDLEPARLVTDAAVPAALATINDTMAEAACGLRSRSIECTRARFEGSITRSGALEFVVDGGRLFLRIPVRYEVTGQGLNWATSIKETKAETVTVSFAYDVSLAAGFGIEVAQRDEPVWSEKQVSVLKSKFDLAKLVGPKLRQALVKSADDVRDAMSAPRFKEATARAWRSLQSPVELSRSAGLWLAADPQRVAGGGFLQENGRISYTAAITSRLAVVEGRPQLTPSLKRLPEPARAEGGAPVARVRLPVFIPDERIQRAIAAALPRDKVLETRADQFSEMLMVRIKAASVFPAMRQLGIELDIALDGPKQFKGMSGKAYLVGRPYYKSETRALMLDGLTFPAVSAKEARDSKETAVPIPIGIEPFASRIATIANIDVARDLKDAAAAASAMFEQALEGDVAMSARFEEPTVTEIEPIKGGLHLVTEMRGEMILRPDPLVVRTTVTNAQLPQEPVR
jgi:Domain of unknown function (DUF4403)